MKNPMEWTTEEAKRFQIRADADNVLDVAKVTLEAARIGLLHLDGRQTNFHQHAIHLAKYVLATVEAPE